MANVELLQFHTSERTSMCRFEDHSELRCVFHTKAQRMKCIFQVTENLWSIIDMSKKVLRRETSNMEILRRINLTLWKLPVLWTSKLVSFTSLLIQEFWFEFYSSDSQFANISWMDLYGILSLDYVPLMKRCFERIQSDVKTLFYAGLELSDQKAVGCNFQSLLAISLESAKKDTFSVFVEPNF